MNLRVLQVSVAIGLATACGGLAQPATVSLHLVPGFNAISTPLLFGGNSVRDLFPVAPQGAIFYKYNSGTGDYVANPYNASTTGWQMTSGFGGTLRPGEGAWLYVPAPADFGLTGERPVVPPLLQLRLAAFNFVGCPHTLPCAFNDFMGFAPAAGDQVFLFNQALPALPAPPNFAQTPSSKHQFTPAGWDVAPVFGIGRGAFVFLAETPRVTIQPSRQVVAAGSTAQFTAVPLGGNPTAFRWRFEGTSLSQNGATLTLPNVGPAQDGRYTVEAIFGGGLVVTSLAARLDVTVAPAIARPPASLSVIEGKNAKFNVVAAGNKPLFYQWRRAGVGLTPFLHDQTNFIFTNVKTTDAGAFDVGVSNFAGVVFSPAAQLFVLIPPRILVQPQGQGTAAGRDVTLSVQADGTPPLLYQWRLNGNPIPGANGPALTITNAQPTNSGAYRVTVHNAAGAVDSFQAVVRVDAPDFAFADNFGGGTVLSGFFGTVRGLNFGATLQPGEPRLFDKRGGSSVWASYAAPGTGIVTFRTRGSTFDTLLGAYVGTAIGALEEKASDEDRAGFLASEISFNVRQGDLVRIAIDGLGGDQGEFLLSWQFESTGDLLPVILTQPLSRTVAQGSDAIFNVQATGGAISYQWFFNGRPLPQETQPTLAVLNVQTNEVGEYVARLRLGNRLVETRPAELEIHSPDAGLPQARSRSYDKFIDLVDATGGTPGRLVPAAPPVLGYTGSQVFNNNASGSQDGEPLHCGVLGGASRWFSYIAPANGRFYLNTDGSTFDTLLAVYRGCCDFEDLTMVECDNDSGTNGLTSSLSMPASNGVVYYVAVDGVNGARGTVKLNYRLLLPITLTNLAMTTNSLTFKLSATPSFPFTIQRTSNMLGWTSLITTNTSSGNFTFIDTNLPAPRRFIYRSMQVP